MAAARACKTDPLFPTYLALRWRASLSLSEQDRPPNVLAPSSGHAIDQPQENHDCMSVDRTIRERLAVMVVTDRPFAWHSGI